MANRQVNPNRMELMRLKKQLVTARRGHKMLKDKRDELMRQFLEIVKANKALRTRMEMLLASANREMVMARAVIDPAILESALMSGRESLSLDIDTMNIMSVKVPVFSAGFEMSGLRETLPYGMASTGGELDQAVIALKQALPIMIELAESEKTAQLLADEIEKTRRRVNSLEYVMIPELQTAIRSITMKMDENERGNLTRLMKVKDMIVNQAIEKARARDAAASVPE
ncbi:MAG: V-type ATP synthase subunit D [Clostridiaceae bacterium]|nr:V-type ATP synthase subunit D [Clostridiaceae bacterium]